MSSSSFSGVIPIPESETETFKYFSLDLYSISSSIKITIEPFSVYLYIL